MAESRAGFAALIGEPNVGKSTLLNRLVGSKVSIVTHKVQTTRSRIRGVAIHGEAQIVLVDTPGLFEPRRRLERAMVKAAWAALGDADAAVLLIEANKGITEGVAEIMDTLDGGISGLPALAVAVNKVDRVRPEQLLPLADALGQYKFLDAVFLISAASGSGLDGLLDWLAGRLPPGPWLYPADQIADSPMRFLAAEITREKLLLRLHQEIPYQLTVETESWKELRDGSVRIEQVVYVARESHRRIAVGPKGETIKSICIASRKDIEMLVGSRAHLFLRVKLREKWMEESSRYAEMGLDYAEK
ncbi:MAG: GTPase Era [Albidovulum sp.]|nr:GTPase Era [Albidovulum sp.]